MMMPKAFLVHIVLSIKSKPSTTDVVSHKTSPLCENGCNTVCQHKRPTNDGCYVFKTDGLQNWGWYKGPEAMIGTVRNLR